MTTESKQDTPQVHRTGVSPLLGGAVAGTAAVTGLVALGALVDGSSGALGALVGGGLTLVVFLLGVAVVTAVARALPAASLMVALLTYTLQLLALALVVGTLERSGLAGDELSRGWFAAGVITVTCLWLAGQLAAATRQRIPAFAEPLEAPHPGGER
jgi:ATP synthase protein I